MRRFAKYLILTAGVAACDPATKAVGPEGADPPALAAANLVDPSTLIPVPPGGAVCRADGRWIICHTEVINSLMNEPVAELPCGTAYETSTDVRHSIRWYTSDRELVKRFYTRDIDGTWSLSPAGSGPSVTVGARDNWRSVFTVPGDLSTEYGATAGDGGKLQAPGFGVIANVAGLDKGDRPHRGFLREFDDPAVIQELCAALTR